ncbi:VOC family protein [Pontixanthobacter aestiaquae]|uniref:VOC family protein n=1 Tax=Pontixanthobacter aestiaquae TaxID=1509367 RepID=A0A844ZAQ0_9SPHN|nr:VOC family protein [Pontixanthobacter aestiaquae]MDN3644844.1 VOC family protein [Pontixanthobacter aestiaquae]MXO84153.1 VOC family protein [Pontixanthobacter aestiaquae]
MAKITGLGGVFYVAQDPAATREWYREKLGIDCEYGPQLNWSEETGDTPYSLISHFKDDAYIKPGKGGFMINLRVDDLDGFVEVLKSRDVEILDSVDEGYGKFAWLLDPDGVKIELWEQVEAPG